jgi:uncharacterized phage protein (TIGR01671 family)
MRTIKFRAWNKEDVKMYSPCSMVSNFNPENCSYDSETKTCIYMQFTGLFDKNGKEIYEGDIVVAPNYYYQPDDGSNPNVLSKVEYKNGGFRTPDISFTEVLDEKECEEVYEVIGNIYQNPELL